MGKILVIDEDVLWWDVRMEPLDRYHNFSMCPFQKDMEIHTKLKNQDYDCILLSLDTSPSAKFDLIKNIQEITQPTPIIVFSNCPEPETIKKASEKGVSDFLTKPFFNEKLLLSIERSLEIRQLKNEIDYLKRQEDIVYDFSKVIAFSDSMKEVIVTLKKFSRTDGTILITGETGTGKSFLSGSLHYNSCRRDRPFIKINCANLPENLLESELFGHEKGAFTGADKTRVGRLEQAKGGTVFLDEIGEMGLGLQAKLLRVLEDKCFERVGGNKTIYADVRIIAATNRKPEQQVASGDFRQDLYYRLNVLRVHLPPLRERKECIEPLASHLLEKFCCTLKLKSSGFSPEVLNIIRTHPWPGNIRELANTIERALILEEGPMITTYNFVMPAPIAKAKIEDVDEGDTAGQTQSKSLESSEKNNIIEALESSDWIQKNAAGKLGVSPRVLNYKIRKFGITHPRWRKNI